MELLKFQKEEITEYEIYSRLARKAGKNKDILERIAKEELGHYNKWKKYTGIDIKPSKFKIAMYMLFAKLFGITFAIKLMEGGEKEAKKIMKKLWRKYRKR